MRGSAIPAPNCRQSGPPIKAANQSFVFDEISVNTLKARGLSFEPMFTGRPDYWIGP